MYMEAIFLLNKKQYETTASDKILESLVPGTKAKATVTSQYLNTTAPNSSCHQASHSTSQLRRAIHRIAHPRE